MDQELEAMRAALNAAKRHAEEASGKIVVWSATGPIGVRAMEALVAVIEEQSREIARLKQQLEMIAPSDPTSRP